MSEPILPQRTRDYLAHGAPEGRRNEELFAAAQQFRDAGYGTLDLALASLQPEAPANSPSNPTQKESSWFHSNSSTGHTVISADRQQVRT